jgi:hypothetical protein
MPDSFEQRPSVAFQPFLNSFLSVFPLFVIIFGCFLLPSSGVAASCRKADAGQAS